MIQIAEDKGSSVFLLGCQDFLFLLYSLGGMKMQKKIKIEVWVEPATNAGGLSQFIDNIKQFAEDLTKYGVPDMGENAYDLEIVDTEAKICDEQN